MQVVRAIGGRAPLHLTSVGKLFPRRRRIHPRARVRDAPRGLSGHTQNSITDLAKLERETAARAPSNLPARATTR